MSDGSVDPSFVRLPKVVLHDHLDGGLRPATAIELAAAVGHRPLAEADEETARALLTAPTGSLERYLSVFSHSTAVLQGPEALARAAAEAVVDLAADGVVYAEVRFAPQLHTRATDLEGAIGAVCDGLGSGRASTGIPVRLIVTALRDRDPDESAALARAAVGARAAGVVGFDLAGPEDGHPAAAHRRAVELARRGGLGVTLHAGETGSLAEVDRALDLGADRIGHGTALGADLLGRPGSERPGPVLRRVIEAGVHLEACPTSNVHTGVVPDLASHPAARLVAAGADLSVHPDNRTASRTSASAEAEGMARHHGWGAEELLTAARRAALAAFCDDALRAEVLALLDTGR